jgi:hypothetical protein
MSRQHLIIFLVFDWRASFISAPEFGWSQCKEVQILFMLKLVIVLPITVAAQFKS